MNGSAPALELRRRYQCRELGADVGCHRKSRYRLRRDRRSDLAQVPTKIVPLPEGASRNMCARNHSVFYETPNFLSNFMFETLLRFVVTRKIATSQT